MKILSTRSKVSLRRFYESFISNKQYKSYVRDITSFSNEEFHEKHQGLFFLAPLRTQEFIESSRQCKPPVDPCLEDRHGCLDIGSDHDHLILVNAFLDSNPHWVFENDYRM
jgi:hypothetical protein